MANKQLEVRERIYVTSDKRVVVPEGDERARFLLMNARPVTAAEARNIRNFRFGGNYLFEIGSPKSGTPEEDTAGQPEADKGGEPEADKGGEPQADKSGEPEGDKASQGTGPDDPLTFGKYEGTLVRDLPEKYLNNLVRVSVQHRPMAEVELARRAEGD